MAAWYCGSTKWTAVTAWAALTAYVIGDLRRQLAAVAAGNERVFRCTTAGTSLASEPSWTITKGGTTTEVAGPVWTEVTGNSTYGWTAAHARLANTLAWAAAGDSIYRSNNHAETQTTAMTLTSPGTAASPCFIYTVNDSATPPTAQATSATISTTGASNITFAGIAYDYGCLYSSGDGSNNARITLAAWTWDTCNLKLNNTNTGSLFNFSFVSTTQGYLVNTILTFGNASQSFAMQAGYLSMIGGSIAGTAPTTFCPANNANTDMLFRGVDFSLCGSGCTLFGLAGTFQRIDVQNCKTGASVVLSSGTMTSKGSYAKFVNCDSADTTYGYSFQNYFGTVSKETTIVRTTPPGATNGTSAFSRKMVSSPNSKYTAPLESDPIMYWNDTLGSITLTVAIVSSGSLTNGDIWIEVEELGTSGFPMSVVQTSRGGDSLTPGTTANTTDSTSVWASPPATPVYQTMSVTFTPTGKGWISVRVMLAKASATVYFDPLILTGNVQYMTPLGSVVNYPPIKQSLVIQPTGAY